MNPQAPIYSILQYFSNPAVASSSVTIITKVAVLLALGMYVLFGLVVIRQVTLMTRTVSTPLDGTIKLIAWIHMAAAVAVWWLAFTLL